MRKREVARRRWAWWRRRGKRGRVEGEGVWACGASKNLLGDGPGPAGASAAGGSDSRVLSVFFETV